MLEKVLANLLIIFSAILIFGATARAQETVAAAESHLLQVMIPANAQRVAPESVPAAITEMFDKVTAAAGEGKFRRGDSEVLLWAGDSYQKADAPGILSRLTRAIQNAGWQYSVESVENDVTLFTALRESPHRAVMGFYGVTDEALIVAATEILPNGGAGESVAQNGQVEDGAEPSRPVNNSGGASVVGTWGDGYASIWDVRMPTVGPVSKTPGRSHMFQYKFHPNGSFESVSLMQMTTYSCTTTYFNDKRGRYTVDGDRLTLTLTKNFWRQQNSCSSSGNKEISHQLTPEVYTFRVKRNDRGKETLCFDSGSGNGEACYERKEE